MRMKALALVGAMIALSALPAKAETKWTGLYVGLQGGLDNSSTELTVPTMFGVDGISTSGMSYGAVVGFDYQIPGTKLVLGIGGDYTKSDTEFKVTMGPMTALTAGIDESWAVFGRIGLDAGRVMPYVIGGYTEADVSAAVFPGTPVAEKGSDKMKGWLAGGGFEMALYQGVTLGFEYRYTKFDTLDVFDGDLKLDTDRHQVMGRLSYKFGGLF